MCDSMSAVEVLEYRIADAEDDIARWRQEIAALGGRYSVRANVNRIRSACANHFGIDIGAMLSHQRALKVVRARSIAMYMCRNMLGMSLSEVGRSFGRDHTTVLYAVRSVQGKLDCHDDATVGAYSTIASVVEKLNAKGEVE